MNTIILKGCTPEPLMSYLKALGVLRIIAEGPDPDIRGCWRDGVLTIKSILDEQSLIDFFDSAYQPTPVFAPWNGDGGFLTDSGASMELVNKIRSTTYPNLMQLKNAISSIDNVSILKDFKEQRDVKKKLEDKKKKLKKTKQRLSESEAEQLKEATRLVNVIKNDILYRIRTGFPDEVVRWLDSCVAITADGFNVSPLLGSGGVDGKLEMSANFMKNVVAILDADQATRTNWIKHAILGQGIVNLQKTAIGQFSPGHVGGPNATQGFEGDSGINPFDFVLMIEGAIFISGAVSRRYGTDRSAKAAFPFTVYSSPIGYGSKSDADAKGSRGEIWLPLWNRLADIREVNYLFSEGRADLSGRQATSGVDFARAVSTLGVDRGIQGFTRYSFLQRNGKAYLASPIGSFEVMVRPNVDLLREIDPWLDRFRPAATEDKTPPRFKSAQRKIETAIFSFCQYGGPSRFADILCALGQAEKELAYGENFRKDNYLRPLAGLSPKWLEAAYDESPEFEIALSLAGIYDASYKIGTLRANLEPVKTGKNKQGSMGAAWSEGGREVVWISSELIRNLAAVLERRIMDGGRAGCYRLPISCRRTSSLDAIAAFIAGATDDRRIEELLWGMLLIDHYKDYPLLKRRTIDAPPLPRSYALLKLLFIPGPLTTQNENVEVRPEMAILPLLRAKRVDDACQIALRRLRASGFIPQAHQTARQWYTPDPARLAASLLIPVASRDVEYLKSMVLRPETNNQAVAR